MIRIIKGLLIAILGGLVALGLVSFSSDGLLMTLLAPTGQSLKRQPSPHRLPLLGTNVVNYTDGKPYYPKWEATDGIQLNKVNSFHTPTAAVHLTGRLSEPQSKGNARLEFPVLNGNVIFTGRVRMAGKPLSSQILVHVAGNKIEAKILLLSVTTLCHDKPNQWAPFRVPIRLPFDSWRNYFVVSLEGGGEISLDELKVVQEREDKVVMPDDFGVIQEFPGARFTK